MVTVFKFRKMRFQVYSKEHPPAHVYVISADARCKIDLHTFEVIDNYGFSRTAVKMIIREVAARSVDLLGYWEENHGGNKK